MSSSGEAADFTTEVSNPVICQHCYQSFKEGTELYYMYDMNPDHGGKKVCAGCHQYYLRKMEAHESQLTLSGTLFADIKSVG